jgi:ectoine hydroxylase-related dioxygenase (phytanoyl-CoA dioxygenase family)
MKLTYAQKQAIYEQGYVKVPGVIPRVMANAALRAINHSLGEGMNAEDMATLRAQSYCRELQTAPVITDLLTKTPAWSLAESVIGNIKPVHSAQIALRFPSLQDPPSPPHPHLDGMHTPTNGVPSGQILNFTMLLGVVLSDVPAPFSGNLAVWPGTHHLYERYFREHGWESLLHGMPPIELPQPEQLTAQAGDVVLCHYQLAHGITANVSPNIRYAIYFRLYHDEHEAYGKQTMTDIWLEWPGMQNITGRPAVSGTPNT